MENNGWSFWSIWLMIYLGIKVRVTILSISLETLIVIVIRIDSMCVAYGVMRLKAKIL